MLVSVKGRILCRRRPCNTAAGRVGDEDRLFGSVTSQNITALLKEKGYEVDRRAVELEEPIRALGVYNIEVRLHPQVTSSVKLWVVKA